MIRQRRALLFLALLVTITALVGLLLGREAVMAWAGRVDHLVQAFPWLALACALILISAWSLLLPTMIPTLLAGYWFGMLWGCVLTYTATTLAFVLAFAVARRWAQNGVQAWLLERPRAAALQQALITRGWRIVFLMRLSPVVPFNIQNYCYGASSIRFWPCLGASLLGKLPNTVLTVASGALLRSGVEREGLPRLGLIVGLGASALLLVWIMRLARRELAAVGAAGV